MAVVANTAKNPLQDLHEKLRHLNIKDVKSIIKDQKMHAVDIECCNEELQKCEVCGKISRVPFGRSTSTNSSALELIHTDICGPMRVLSFAGSRYFATFVDDKTRYCEMVFMAQKSEIFEKFKIFKAKVEKQTGLKIKNVRSDNDREYLSNKFKDFFEKEGIVHQLTTEYTPEQNGVAERFTESLQPNTG